MSDSEKPAILQDQEFTIEEGFLYRALRTAAIWMNKLFFSSLALLGIWLLWGYSRGASACDGETCSVLLTETSLFLGAMAVLTFLFSIVFGLLGLVVGKNVIAVARAEEEVGAPREQP